MANDLRKCKACGKEYKYCPTCSKYAHFPAWMWKCDTEDCNDIFDAVSAYRMGVAGKEVITNALNKHNITDYSKYTEAIQQVVNEVSSVVEKPYKYKNNKHKKYVEEVVDIDLKEEPKEVVDELLDLPIIPIDSETDGISDL